MSESTGLYHELFFATVLVFPVELLLGLVLGRRRCACSMSSDMLSLSNEDWDDRLVPRLPLDEVLLLPPEDQALPGFLVPELGPLRGKRSADRDLDRPLLADPLESDLFLPLASSASFCFLCFSFTYAVGSNRGSLPPAGEGVLLRMPDDCFDGGLLSWEMDRRGARPLLVAEPLVWAGDGLGPRFNTASSFVKLLHLALKFRSFARISSSSSTMLLCSSFFLLIVLWYLFFSFISSLSRFCTTFFKTLISLAVFAFEVCFTSL